MDSAIPKKRPARRRPLGESCLTLAEWLERSGQNQTMLRERLAVEQRYQVSAGHLCDVIKGSSRCSLALALALWRVTGVPVERIAEWPRVRPYRNVRSSGKKSVA